MRFVRPIWLLVVAVTAFTSGARAETDPAAVVEAFCRLDAEGKRLAAESFPEMFVLATAVEVEREGRMVVIAGYTVGAAAIDRETATVAVEYDELGAMNAMVFERRRRKQTVTFRLIQTASGWLITDWVAVPRVLGSAAIGFLQATAAPDRRAGLEPTIHAIRRAAGDNALLQ